MAELNGVRVAVLATDGFEEAELVEPVKALKNAGATITIIAPDRAEIQGMQHMTKGSKVKVDRTLGDVSPEDFDGVLLPGGTVNADQLRVVPGVQQFLRALQEAGKPIAAICHAPWELISAGLVAGRTLTGYHTIRDDILNAGGIWEDREVVVDDNWVTSRQPSDIPAFNREILKLFARCLVASHD